MNTKKPDYSKKEYWYLIPEITKEVDTFYVYATEYIITSLEEGASDYATFENEEMLQGVVVEYNEHAKAFEDSTNVFLPYYRQSGLRYAGAVFERDGNLDAALVGMPYDDIAAALDYYFENYNQGRPFIIAGHSQGSAIVRLLLKDYFVKHPDYYNRMVAAYPIGYSFIKEDFETCPQLKFAEGETDTGVIVSWGTEGPKNVEVNAPNVALLPGGYCINPLNWKRDETYAPASMNLGSLVTNEETGERKIADIGADAQVNVARGVVITNAKGPEVTEEVAAASAVYFGPDGRHAYDYTFFFNNIKDNVAKRVAAYQSSAK